MIIGCDTPLPIAYDLRLCRRSGFPRSAEPLLGALVEIMFAPSRGSALRKGSRP